MPRSFVLNAEPGSYTITGAPTSLQVVRVIPVAFSLVPGEPHWHVLGHHDDPVVLITEGAVVGLFLVVVIARFWTSIRYVQRPLS